MLMHSASETSVRTTKLRRRKQRRPFPYARLAKMWVAGKTIAVIAHTLGRIDKHNPKDPYHSLRNFMYRMRRWGYRNGDGKLVKLPRRVGNSTVKACQRAGLRAWA
jgi:hypothetical protein